MKPFNLLRSFSIFSFLCIAVITLVTAVLLTRFLAANMLHRDAVVTMQFVQALIETMDPSVYLSTSKIRIVTLPPMPIGS